MRKGGKESEEISRDVRWRVGREVVKGYCDLVFEIEGDEKVLRGMERGEEEIRGLKSEV